MNAIVEFVVLSVTKVTEVVGILCKAKHDTCNGYSDIKLQIELNIHCSTAMMVWAV